MSIDNALMSGVPDTVGERIRARRLALRISQFDLAAGMRDHGFRWWAQTVHRIENGDRKVVADELPALGSLLGIAPGGLVPGWKDAA